KLEHSVVIGAPLDKVFDFTTDWRNFANYFGYVREVKPATEKTVGEGARFSVRVKFMGMMMSSEWEMTEYVKNDRMTFITPLTGVRAIKRWRFIAVEGSTRVNFSLEYKPWPLFGPLLDVLFIKSYWDKLSEKLVQNLKRLIEA
ncbi:MAG TPA: SRPBCC family protein, partial [Dehalococcoidales bacterium]|nr:SRPBCC family protein [Dehalococcoidales bacterium]